MKRRQRIRGIILGGVVFLASGSLGGGAAKAQLPANPQLQGRTLAGARVREDVPSREDLIPTPFACTDGCDGCITGVELDRYLAFRQEKAASIERPGLRGGGPSFSAMGGLVILEDDGSFTDDNGGSVWDLDGAQLSFVPVGGSPGFFDATRTGASPDLTFGTLEDSFLGSWGEHVVNLPFSFPFGSSSYNTLYVTSDFGVFFASQPSNNSGFQYAQDDLSGTEPRITPLLRDSPWIWADVVDLYVKTTSQTVTLTWHEQASRPESNPHLDRIFQVVLDDAGRIELHYPDAASYCTYGAVQVIAPGPAGSSLTDVSSLTSTPTQVRYVRQAFTFPTLLPFSVESFMDTQYGLNDLNVDAIAIYQNHFTEITSFAGAYHTNGRPGATGIGNDGDRRTSLLHMNQIDLSWNYRDDGSKVSVLSHELGHRWLFFISGVGASNAGAHPAQNAHLPAPFNWFLGSESSCMGGTVWTDNLDGTFTSPPQRTYYSYSWLELYLMGLASTSEVAPWWYVDGNPSLNGPYYPPNDSTFSGTRVDLTITDVVNANGARTPAYPAAQDEFEVAIVLLTRPENPAIESDIANVRSKMELWMGAWEQSVDDRGSLETELAEIVGTGDLDCNFNGISDAVEIGGDGSLDCNSNGVLDTCESFPTITLTPQSTTVSPGGVLFYDVEVRNDTAVPHTLDGWLDAFRPGDVPYSGNPIGGPKSITLNPGAQTLRTVRIRVPASGIPAPSGPFTIRGSLGRFPDCATSSSSFEFNVVP